MELNLKGRQKLITTVTAKKCRIAKKSEKARILFTFIEQTGYNRKYAIHLLANEGGSKTVKKELKAKITQKGGKKRICPAAYGKEVLDALALAWEAFNCQYGKLLAPFLRSNIDAVAKKPKFNFGNEVAARLKKISAQCSVKYRHDKANIPYFKYGEGNNTNSERKNMRPTENLLSAGYVEHKYAVRLQTLPNHAEDVPANTVAPVLGIDLNSVSNYVKHYSEGGIENLLRDKTRKPGKAPISPEVKKGSYVSSAKKNQRMGRIEVLVNYENALELAIQQ
jgi:hypothetical protein